MITAPEPGAGKSLLLRELDRYLRALRARHNSERTITIYRYAVRYLDEFLARQGMARTRRTSPASTSRTFSSTPGRTTRPRRY